MLFISKPYDVSSFYTVCILVLYQASLQAPQVTAKRIKASRNFNPINLQALSPPQCGTGNIYKDSRIIGGYPAKLGAWPWLALLGYSDKKKNELDFDCGGALISSRTVLTAAHCFDGHLGHDFRLVRLGEHTLFDDTDGSNPIDYPAKRIIKHPNYIAKEHENDVALVVLADAVEFTDSIHPICLPLRDDLRNRDFDQDLPFIAGWGISGNYHGDPSNILMEARVPVVTTAKCKKNYKYITNTTINHRSMCAGDDGIGTCHGDSGGPLMLPIRKTYYAIGIVSNGYKCAKRKYPAVFMRVTSYLDFILKNIIL